MPDPGGATLIKFLRFRLGMGTFTVFSTNTFDRVFRTLDQSERQWILRTRTKLELNPTGKRLTFSWFREKKYGNKRLLYLVDDKARKVLLVTFASKKEQQRVINFVKKNMAELLNHLRRL